MYSLECENVEHQSGIEKAREKMRVTNDILMFRELYVNKRKKCRLAFAFSSILILAIFLATHKVVFLALFVVALLLVAGNELLLHLSLKVVIDKDLEKMDPNGVARKALALTEGEHGDMLT